MKAEALYVAHPPSECFLGYTKEDIQILDAFAREGT